MFLFKVIATTEIYTYGQHLSRTDALPISDGGGIGHRRIERLVEGGIGIARIVDRTRVRTVDPVIVFGCGEIPDPARARYLEVAAPRSEEHTSELQPLMRSTSAVLGFKKTIHNHPNIHDEPAT